ncbi:MAG: hypothetical protein IJT82_06375, partial [Schwartzia sp.]|nr:hypothetical protein [Schwartzia sp. (in: firmicutes)]
SAEKVYCDCDEFAELWRFLSERQKLETRVGHLVPIIMYRIYKWNYGRIADKYKIDFFSHVIKEFEEMEKRGFLKSECWEEAEWSKVNAILGNPEKALMRAFERLQRGGMYATGFLNEIEKRRSVCIYGAGKVGKEVLDALIARGIDVRAFVVSSHEGNPEEVRGVPVIALEDMIPADGEVVLVAIREKDQYGVIAQLRRKGIEKIIAMTNELRAALRKIDCYEGKS